MNQDKKIDINKNLQEDYQQCDCITHFSDHK